MARSSKWRELTDLTISLVSGAGVDPECARSVAEQASQPQLRPEKHSPGRQSPGGSRRVALVGVCSGKAAVAVSRHKQGGAWAAHRWAARFMAWPASESVRSAILQAARTLLGTLPLDCKVKIMMSPRSWAPAS